ncbi:unnamed protein product [Callosobruchus maculatus]|uniref:DUF4780 domain-containing protein n=1 Tax=Callosobruchus maculatus TaxID=64391 RepID=A0A653DFS1_CALMS|nr:unnamed protein product [Callosobruchus maculatus]
MTKKSKLEAGSMKPPETLMMCKVTTFVSRAMGAETKEDVMLGLKNQSGLDTDHWVVVGGNATPEGQLLAFHVDKDSLQKLKELECVHFLEQAELPSSCRENNKRRSATATLCQNILFDDTGVVLIQKLWTIKASVMEDESPKSWLIYDTKCDRPRACVFVKDNIKALKRTDLCAVTEVHLQTGEGTTRILIASVYLPYTLWKHLRPQRAQSEQGTAPWLDPSAHHVA